MRVPVSSLPRTAGAGFTGDPPHACPAFLGSGIGDRSSKPIIMGTIMTKLTAQLCVGALLAYSSALAQEIPAADKAMRYYDRHLIDVSNLRTFTEGAMIADMMIHADAMFDAEDKWKMTLYQMIRAGSAHHQARSAFQLSHLGVPMEEILAIWEPGYIDTIAAPRLKAAFTFVDQLATLPEPTYGTQLQDFGTGGVGRLDGFARLSPDDLLHQLLGGGVLDAADPDHFSVA